MGARKKINIEREYGKINVISLKIYGYRYSC
jgi:hypothetical protein